MKKIVKYIFIFLLIVYIISYFCSYHEINNIEMIESIKFSDYLDINETKYYTSIEDIKNAERKIRNINFYHNSKGVQLQQSPTMSITINYKNGEKKEILMVEENALIANTTKEGYISGDFYYVNPFLVRLKFTRGCN